jgi:hypothetical protein
MKKSTILVAVCLCAFFQAIAQHTYIVSFKDKGDISTYDQNQLLSRKTLNKRALAGIGVDLYDYPVNKKYLQELRDHDVRVISSSKWLNAALVATNLSP